MEGQFILNSFYNETMEDLSIVPYGYFRHNGDDYPIKSFGESNKAISGDTVNAIIQMSSPDSSSDPPKCIITKIIKRASSIIPGTLILNSRTSYGVRKRGHPYFRFEPHNPIYPIFLVATNKEYSSVNIYCLVKVVDWSADSVYPFGVLENVIGKVGEIQNEIEFMKFRNSIKHKKYKFNPKKTAQNQTPVQNKTSVQNQTPHQDSKSREDLRHLNILSIDPPFCKDIDDALHVERKGDSIEIGIHIADVSSFVMENSELDLNAMLRGETVYLDKMKPINMLPEYLCNDLCSLLEGKERITLSAIVMIKDGGISKVEFKRGLIINRKNYTYDEAESLITGASHGEPYMTLALSELYEMGKTIGKLVGIYDDSEYDCHKMVEYYMILCNKLVAEFIVNKSPNNCLLRSCEGPIKSSKELECPKIVLDEINKCCNSRATYTCGLQNNKGHSPLNLTYYTHMTSPIRRYFDIVVHRMLCGILFDYDPHLDPHPDEFIKYSTMCSKLNEQKDNIAKSYYELDMISIMDRVMKMGSVLDAYGYIVGIDDNKLYVYIDELDLRSVCYVVPDKLKKYIEYYSKNDIVEFDGNVYKVGDKVKLKIVIAILEHKFNEKIKVSLNY